MIVTDEKLSAYIDGELSPGEVADLNKALQTDSTLAARLERLKRPDALIAAAYSEINDEPMPDGVMDLLRGTNSVESADENVFQFTPKPVGKSPAPWITPLAASVALAIGVGVGMQIASDHTRDNGQFAVAGVIDPSNPLYAALESTPSGVTTETETGALTPVLTFRSVDERYCREFSINKDNQLSHAVACRTDAGWETRFAVFGSAAVRNNDQYSTASSSDDDNFETFVSTMMANDALSQNEEKALLGRW